MPKTCPECEYVLGEFDDNCPRCGSASAKKTDPATTAEVHAPLAKAAEPAPVPPSDNDSLPDLLDMKMSNIAAPVAKKPEPAAASSKPEESENDDKPEPRFNQRVLATGLGAFVGFVLLYFISTHMPKLPGAKGAPEINVPELVGLSSKQLVDKLGKPDEETKPTDDQITAGSDDATMTWKKGARTIFVNYHIKKSDVVDIFVSTSDPSGTTSNINEVKGAAEVSDNDDRYTVDAVPVSGEEGTYTGIRVTPSESVVKASIANSKPDAARPAATSADVTKPDVTRPDDAKSEVTRP